MASGAVVSIKLPPKAAGAQPLGQRTPLAADAIAEARAGNGGDNRAVEIGGSPLTTVAEVGEAGLAAAPIEAALDGADTPG